MGKGPGTWGVGPAAGPAALLPQLACALLGLLPHRLCLGVIQVHLEDAAIVGLVHVRRDRPRASGALGPKFVVVAHHPRRRPPLESGVGAGRPSVSPNNFGAPACLPFYQVFYTR